MDFNAEYKKWTDFSGLPAELREELLAAKDNPSLLEDMLAANLSFGTGGMRGVLGAGNNRMNIYTVGRAAYGLGKYITEAGADAMRRGVLISFDTRHRSRDFALHTARILANMGVRVIITENVRPVPMVSFAVRKLNTFSGVMITASHNPPEYNGFKVYGEDGAQLNPDDTAKMVAHIVLLTDMFTLEASDKADALIDVAGTDTDEAFYNHIYGISCYDTVAAKCPLKVVYTPLHGAGYIPVTSVLRARGIKFDVVKEQCEYDGDFPTVKSPNPENAEAFTMGIELAKKNGANLIIATDPDCDRMGAAVKDGTGSFKLLTGNQIGALLLDYILTRRKEAGCMPEGGGLFIKTIVTTSLGTLIAKDFGVKTEDVLTGFKFIGEKMKEYEETGEKTFLFGYEESYGYLAHSAARDKDAVSASMLMAEMACYYYSQGKTVNDRLNELFSRYGHFKEATICHEYKGLTGMKQMVAAMGELDARVCRENGAGGLKLVARTDYNTGIKTYTDGRETERISQPPSNVFKYELENENWLAVRPSGTEPKLKIYFGVRGGSDSECDALIERLSNFSG